MLEDLILGAGVNLLEFLEDIIKKSKQPPFLCNSSYTMGLAFSAFFLWPFDI